MLKSIWKWLSGNKTIIGFALLNITQLSFMKNLLGVDLVVVQALLGVLTGVSLAHHIKKKKFTDKTD